MLMGVTVQSVWRWENDVRIPDVPTLQRIARVLETTTAYLAGDTDRPNSPGSYIGLGPVIAFQEIPKDYSLGETPTEETTREHIEGLKRVQESNSAKTLSPADKAEASDPRLGAVQEAAASAVLHGKSQADELISLLVQVRKQMLAEYPQMDVNDKNIVKNLLAKINTLVDGMEGAKDIQNGIA